MNTLKALFLMIAMLGNSIAQAESCDDSALPSGVAAGIANEIRLRQSTTVTKENHMYDMNDSGTFTALDTRIATNVIVAVQVLSQGDAQRVLLKFTQIAESFVGQSVPFDGSLESALDTDDDGEVESDDLDGLRQALQCLQK